MTHVRTITLRAPRITEKATVSMSTSNAYVFNVTQDATKTSIAREIKEVYGVTPIKVNVANTPAVDTFRRGKRGRTSANKKAYVYLKKGDSIAII